MTDVSSLRTKLNTATLLIKEAKFDAAERALRELSEIDTGEALGPETAMGQPRRLHAAWLKLAKARGNLGRKTALQYTLVPPEERLLSLFKETCFDRSFYVAAATKAVPTCLHQVWIGAKPPETTEVWRETCAKRGWTYQLWDETALKGIGASDDTAFKHMLSRDDLPGAVDVARYYVLARAGGLYLDCDWLPMPAGHFDEAFPKVGLSAIAEDTPRRTGAGSPFLNNSVIASPPGHPAIRHLLNVLPEVIRRLPNGPAWWVTGPLVFTLACRMGPVTILDAGLTTAPLSGDRRTIDTILAELTAQGDPAVLAAWKPW